MTLPADLDMFSFFEHTPDLVCIARRDGYFLKVNEAVVRTLGYPLEELLRRPIASFIHPDDRAYTARRRQELLAGQALINLENRYLARGGTTVWLHWTSLYFPDKEVVFAIAKDVTARKRQEEELEQRYRQVMGLATHFKSRLEKDRRSLAAELHEELAQMAAAVHLDLGWLHAAGGLPAEGQQRLEHALSATGLLIDALRRLSYSIGTAMLEEVGLHDTLQWLCEETALLLKAPCRFVAGGEEGQIPGALWVDLFRLAQEVLGALPREEAVKAVTLCLAPEKGGVALSVEVRGAGNAPEGFRRALDAAGLGPLVLSLQGNLAMQQKRGTTFVVRAWVPAPLRAAAPIKLP